MASKPILQEAKKLHNVSDRLDALAGELEDHAGVSEALIIISGNLRNTANLLEVLVVTKLGPLSGIGSNECLPWPTVAALAAPARS